MACCDEINFKIREGIIKITGATIEVGETVTVDPDQPAKVENVGTDENVILQFSIPRGQRGLTGLGLEFDWQDTRLGVRIEGEQDYQYVDLKGEKGDNLEFTWRGTELGVRVEGDEDYQYVDLKGYAGPASPNDTPDVQPGVPAFYTATEEGVYINFGGIEITEDDSLVILSWDGDQWSKQIINIEFTESSVKKWNLDEGLAFPEVRTHNGYIWRVKEGHTTSDADEPSIESDVWENITVIRQDITGTIIPDQIVGEHGTYSPRENSSATEGIDVSGLDYILYTGRALSQSGLMFYDEDDVFLQIGYSRDSDVVYAKYIPIPQGAKYVRASSRESDVQVKIEKVIDVQEISDNVDSLNVITSQNEEKLEKITNIINSGYYSSYNDNDNEESYTELQGELPLLSNPGDFVEFNLRVKKQDTYRDTLSLLSGGSANRFGYYSDTEFRMRAGTSAGNYLIWSGLNDVIIFEWHQLRVERTQDGYELFINDVSRGELIEPLDFSPEFIGKSIINATNPQQYDIQSVRFSNYEYLNPIALYVGSVNVELKPFQQQGGGGEGINPKMFYEFNKASNLFKVYQRHSEYQDIYFMFQVELQDSTGTNVDDILYKNIWRITRGWMYRYNAAGNNMIQLQSIIEDGESEFVYMSSGLNGDKVDHTGGTHGDERIDVEQSSFIMFFIDGIPVDISNDIPLTECGSARYAQRSTLHDTAEIIKDYVTDIDATGQGELTIQGDNNFFIDDVDTGVKAYAQNSLLSSTENLTTSASDSGKWEISEVIVVDESHPIVGDHFKETIFENCGYNTVNRVIFRSTVKINHWYHGICCFSKNAAKFVYNEDFVIEEATADGSALLSSNNNRTMKGYNPDTNMSGSIITKMLVDSEHIKDTGDNVDMFVRDRSADSKYYRQIKNFIPDEGETATSQMIVKFDYKG